MRSMLSAAALLSLLCAPALAQEDPPPAADSDGDEGAAVLEPDLSLLGPRARDDRDEDAPRDPYIALFEHGEKQLLFLAARHEQDIENDPTHRLVKEAIEGFAPQALIIEGVNTSLGFEPQPFLRDARRRVPTGKAPEAMYSAVLASEQGAVVIGGEPDPEVTVKAVHEAGFSDEDLLGFLLARRAVGMVRKQGIADGFEGPATQALRGLKRRYSIESEFDHSDFLAWYEEHLSGPFDPERVKAEVSPTKVEDPTILRRMAVLVMMVREHNLMRLEAKLLGEHDRVMVVYGSGHLRWERAALTKMMGPPVFLARAWPTPPEEVEPEDPDG